MQQHGRQEEEKPGHERQRGQLERCVHALEFFRDYRGVAPNLAKHVTNVVIGRLCHEIR